MIIRLRRVLALLSKDQPQHWRECDRPPAVIPAYKIENNSTWRFSVNGNLQPRKKQILLSRVSSAQISMKACRSFCSTCMWVRTTFLAGRVESSTAVSTQRTGSQIQSQALITCPTVISLKPSIVSRALSVRSNLKKPQDGRRRSQDPSPASKVCIVSVRRGLIGNQHCFWLFEQSGMSSEIKF